MTYFLDHNLTACNYFYSILSNNTPFKVNDPRYAKKYGVSKLPSLVYFRRKFPSIYRGQVLQGVH